MRVRRAHKSKCLQAHQPHQFLNALTRRVPAFLLAAQECLSCTVRVALVRTIFHGRAIRGDQTDVSPVSVCDRRQPGVQAHPEGHALQQQGPGR